MTGNRVDTRQRGAVELGLVGSVGIRFEEWEEVRLYVVAVNNSGNSDSKNNYLCLDMCWDKIFIYLRCKLVLMMVNINVTKKEVDHLEVKEIKEISSKNRTNIHFVETLKVNNDTMNRHVRTRIVCLGVGKFAHNLDDIEIDIGVSHWKENPFNLGDQMIGYINTSD